MVQFGWITPEPDITGRRSHIRTLDVNPGETCIIEQTLLNLAEAGVRAFYARIPHVGQIGGITRDGMIWTINPN